MKLLPFVRIDDVTIKQGVNGELLASGSDLALKLGITFAGTASDRTITIQVQDSNGISVAGRFLIWLCPVFSADFSLFSAPFPGVIINNPTSGQNLGTLYDSGDSDWKDAYVCIGLTDTTGKIVFHETTAHTGTPVQFWIDAFLMGKGYSASSTINTTG